MPIIAAFAPGSAILDILCFFMRDLCVYIVMMARCLYALLKYLCAAVLAFDAREAPCAPPSSRRGAAMLQIRLILHIY